MASEERVTYCRICEPLCGMVATVEDGRITRLRPDSEHPLSQGFACPKGIAFAQVQNDPDRVLHPLRRRADGEFERVSWDTALADITERLGAVRQRHGSGSIGWYQGNPAAFSYSHAIWVKGFLDALGTPHFYGAGSQDVNNRFAASALMYGSPVIVPIPDLARTDFLLVVGANPLVSHGSVMSAPRVKDQLHGITGRGGRVVVVDPRRSETARAFEHLPINPDADAWLLLSLLNVIFDEGLEDAGAIGRQSTGIDALRAIAAQHPPEATADRTGVPAPAARQLARDLAGATAAAVYGRTGSCLGQNATLVSYLLDALNLVTGNLDREGGAVFGDSPLPLEDLAERIGLASYAQVRSRIGGFPDVLGSLPASLMAKEITTAGEGQIRALFVSAGNPVLSVPNGDELDDALGELELMVSLDMYVNETNRHADYVLPATTMYERDDFPIAFLTLFTTPFIQSTEPVVEPAGEAREEWRIIEDISRPLGIVPSSVWVARLLGRVGIRLSPRRLVELLLRTGPQGDLFGLRRGGLNMKKLTDNPHGIVLGANLKTGLLRSKLRTKGKRVRLDPPELIAEAESLEGRNGHDPEFPLRMIGLRELRSHNSWMHNAPKLMAGDRVHAARIHPRDAEAVGIADGDACRIVSPDGEIELTAKVTDEMIPGAIAVPHGWGHRGGWRVANAAGGSNVNVLASSDPEALERLAGMAFLNGIPVRVEPVASAAAPPAGVAEEALAGTAR